MQALQLIHLPRKKCLAPTAQVLGPTCFVCMHDGMMHLVVCCFFCSKVPGALSMPAHMSVQKSLSDSSPYLMSSRTCISARSRSLLLHVFESLDAVMLTGLVMAFTLQRVKTGEMGFNTNPHRVRLIKFFSSSPASCRSCSSFLSVFAALPLPASCLDKPNRSEKSRYIR
jgi:hypothetical protein